MLKYILLGLILTTQVAAQSARYVDPMIGVDGGGNTFPGASLPFGMVKPGPDMGSSQSNAGWEPSGNINGFSQTHVSGTGGGPKYGNILLQPTTGAPQGSNYGSPRTEEQASAGYYRVTLSRYQTAVEITTAARASLYRITYPAAAQQNILFDVSHMLSASNGYGEAQTVVSSALRIVSPTEVEGRSSLLGGWNKQTTPYTVYFYAIADRPAASWGTWNGDVLHLGSRQQAAGVWVNSGGWLTFAPGNTVVRLKIGISFVSGAAAKKNATAEITEFDFDQVHQQAVAAWDRVLAPIELKGASAEDRQVFYTALYHTMLMPVDRSGENPLWQSA